MDDRLYRSRSDRIISGVAAGVAERLDLDPSIVRVVWVVLAVVSGGIFALVYLVMMFVVPEAPFDSPRAGQAGPDPWSSPAATGIRPAAAPVATPADGTPAGVGDVAVDDATEVGVPVTPDTRTDPGIAALDHSPVPARRSDPGGPLVLGVILILLGAYFLLRQYAPQVDVGAAWPVLAIAAGVLLVVLSLVPDRSHR